MKLIELVGKALPANLEYRAGPAAFYERAAAAASDSMYDKAVAAVIPNIQYDEAPAAAAPAAAAAVAPAKGKKGKGGTRKFKRT